MLYVELLLITLIYIVFKPPDTIDKNSNFSSQNATAAGLLAVC